MATHFHGSTSEIHESSSASAADGLHAQTLHLMNSTYTPHHNHHNMLLLNHPNNLSTFHHAPPLQPPSPNNHHPVIHDITTAFHAPNYNLWGPATEQPRSAAATTTQPISIGGGAFRQPSQQGLSLSLSSDQTAYRQFTGELDAVPAAGTGNSPVSVVLGSRYLKGAQELLDEVVNVGGGIYKDGKFADDNKDKMKANRESSSGGGGGGGEHNNSNHVVVAELTTAQRQELQMKKSKLVTMLDEVEQRYKQYHHQMQVVISSFEQAAGFGSAKSYTALALKTISKQFRCLKDAISAQIKATSKSLGEDDCLGVKVEGSRLRYVDHHLRQQRALQQLGMIQPNAWRPQRGLPERAVSILRAWLFEHFLHPYPKDSDKIMLAKQTGLARSQVSNWFINARVRLWKPMVEEMYMEEIKEQEKANGSKESSQSTNKERGSSPPNNVTPESGDEIKLEHIKNLQSSKQESFNTSPTTEISTNSSVGGGPFQSHSGFQLVGSSDHMIQRSSEMQNNSPSSIGNNIRFGNERNHKDLGYHALMTDHGGGFGSLFSSMEDIGMSRFNVTHEQLASRFHGNNNNGVSLTLGLHHNENLPNISATHQHGFLSQNIHLGMGLEMGSTNNGNEVVTGTDYDTIDIQNRKRFSAQSLPDFCGLSG